MRVFPTIRVIDVVTRDDAAADDLLQAAFHENNVAWLHLIRELPDRPRRIRLGRIIVASFEQALTHLFLGGVPPQITELMPPQPHNATLVELLPHTCSFSRSVEPVAHGLHTIITERQILPPIHKAKALSVVGSFFLNPTRTSRQFGQRIEFINTSI